MCLAIPGQLRSIEGEAPFGLLGEVDFGGVTRQINLSYVPEVAVDDWVLVHVGFALSVIDEAEAARVRADLAILAEAQQPPDIAATDETDHP